MLRIASRVPILLAVLGAYLNSAQLLAEFQTDQFRWVAWIAAASIGVGLFLCVEALLHRYHWVLVVGLAFYGGAELSGQILHAAMVRSDVSIMTPMLQWLMGYISPSLVVFSGIVFPLIVRFGFPDDVDVASLPVTRGDLALVVDRMSALSSLPSEVSLLADRLESLRVPELPESLPLASLLEAVNRVPEGVDVSKVRIDPVSRRLILPPRNGGRGERKAVVE